MFPAPIFHRYPRTINAPTTTKMTPKKTRQELTRAAARKEGEVQQLRRNLKEVQNIRRDLAYRCVGGCLGADLVHHVDCGLEEGVFEC